MIPNFCEHLYSGKIFHMLYLYVEYVELCARDVLCINSAVLLFFVSLAFLLLDCYEVTI